MSADKSVDGDKGQLGGETEDSEQVIETKQVQHGLITAAGTRLMSGIERLMGY